MMLDFKDYLSHEQQLVDAQLAKFLPPETQPPAAIHRAMHYSVFAGGETAASDPGSGVRQGPGRRSSTSSFRLPAL